MARRVCDSHFGLPLLLNNREHIKCQDDIRSRNIKQRKYVNLENDFVAADLGPHTHNFVAKHESN